MAPSTPPLLAPKTIEQAVSIIIQYLALDDRRTLGRTPRDQLFQYHHGLGTWIRNTFLAGNQPLTDECVAILDAARRERARYRTIISRCDPRFEELRTSIGRDECSMLLIERLWEALQVRQLE